MRRVLLLAALLGPTAAVAATGDAPMIAVEAGLPEPMIANTSLIGWLAVLPFVIPLFGSALALTLRGRTEWQAGLALATLAVSTLAAVALNATVAQTGTITMAAGEWMPPFGIVIAVDTLGALLVLSASLVGLIALPYARAEVSGEGVRYGFYPLYLLMIAGVAGAFSTGDIFNLYVWFEVFLVASFGLMVVGGRAIQLDGAVKYGVLNLIATTVFLIAVGALYGMTGALNMADLRVILADGPAGPLLTVAALLTLAFAMKAAAFPLHFWLPASYHTPNVVVGALFAGLLTKVGVYTLLRVIVMVFGDVGTPFLAILAWIGVATGLVGALGAVAETNLRRMAAFLVVSGIGVMLIGLGLGTAAGLSGAIVYAVHSIFATTALFLAIGYAERRGGCALDGGANLYALHGLAAATFLVFGLSSAGLPPFSGFWPKLMLVEASLGTTGALAVAGAAGVIVTGFLTTVAVGRAWVLVYLRPGEAADTAPPAPRGEGRLMAATLVVFAVVVVGLGLFPAVVIGPAETGAAGLLDPVRYVDRVLQAE
jgi:multicomponent Na+:H+ antiporter subunit D